MKALWLVGDADELAARIVDDGTRPLLRSRPVSRQLADLRNRRTRANAAAAHHVVDSSGRTVEEVAEEVVALWTGS